MQCGCHSACLFSAGQGQPLVVAGSDQTLLCYVTPGTVSELVPCEILSWPMLLPICGGRCAHWRICAIAV